MQRLKVQEVQEVQEVQGAVVKVLEMTTTKVVSALSPVLEPHTKSEGFTAAHDITHLMGRQPVIWESRLEVWQDLREVMVCSGWKVRRFWLVRSSSPSVMWRNRMPVDRGLRCLQSTAKSVRHVRGAFQKPKLDVPNTSIIYVRPKEYPKSGLRRHSMKGKDCRTSPPTREMLAQAMPRIMQGHFWGISLVTHRSWWRWYEMMTNHTNSQYRSISFPLDPQHFHPWNLDIGSSKLQCALNVDRIHIGQEPQRPTLCCGRRSWISACETGLAQKPKQGQTGRNRAAWDNFCEWHLSQRVA